MHQLSKFFPQNQKGSKNEVFFWSVNDWRESEDNIFIMFRSTTPVLFLKDDVTHHTTSMIYGRVTDERREVICLKNNNDW